MLGKANRMLGERMCLQLICEAPGCWHIPKSGGNYEFEVAPNWQRNLQGGFEKVVKALKAAGPILTAGTGLALSDPDQSIKFMSELAKPLDGSIRDHIDQHDNQFLRRQLIDLDPHGKDWGLQRVITKEGHVYWVCPEHNRQHDNEERFTILD